MAFALSIVPANCKPLLLRAQATEEYLEYYKGKQAEERELKAAEAAAKAAAGEGGDAAAGSSEPAADAVEAAENAAFEKVMGIVADRGPVAPQPESRTTGGGDAAAAANDFLSSLEPGRSGAADGASRDDSRCVCRLGWG